jgi:hypothetical protein
MTMLLILIPIAFIIPTIFIIHLGISINKVVFPVANAFPAVYPFVLTISVDIIIFELALVDGAIDPLVLSLAVHVSIFVITDVSAALRVYRLAFSMRLVIEPETFINIASLVNIFSIAVGDSIHEFTFVDITVGIGEGAVSLHFVILPLADVFGTIWEKHSAKALFDPVLISLHIANHSHLSFILGILSWIPIFSLYQLLILIILIRHYFSINDVPSTFRSYIL